MDALLQDIRYAIRTLAKARGFTAIAVLCLGLGIAANVSVFTPVNTLLLRPLPFDAPERVMGVYTTQTKQERFEGAWSWADYRDLGDAGGVFAATALVAERAWNLGGLAEPERVDGARVSASLFPLLGVGVALGRHIRADEDDAGKVMLISDALWQSRFGGDSSVVGRTLTVNGAPYTVVGVLQKGIRFPETADIWLPLEPAEAKEHRDWRNFELVARLAPRATETQAQANVAATMQRLALRFPETNEGWTGWVEPYRERFSRDVRPIMLILLGAVGFVLLIACANVANLLLARATARHKEIAVRLALGAGRGRIVRQLLTESIILALMGGVLGVVLGTWMVDGIVRMLPPEMPFWMTFEVDGRVVLMTLGLSVLTGIIFGLAPAVQASTPALSETLKDNARGSSASVRTGRLRNTLVIAEIALSLVLLVGATLMIRSFLKTQTAQLGFEADGLLTFQTSLQGDRYATDTLREKAYADVVAAIAEVPGVEVVSAVTQLPIGSCCSFTGYVPEGKRFARDENPRAVFSAILPGYLRTMRIPLLAGREFDARNRLGGPSEVIVNRTFAEREWPGQNPIGRTIRLVTSIATDTLPRTVIGVAQDIVLDDVTSRPRAQLYVPVFSQTGWRTLSIVARTSGDAAAMGPMVRAAVRRVDRDLPVARLRSMPQVIREELFEPRVYGLMFGIFAVSALVLASIGLYGVMSYSVAQRTHEIGVRMALGAQPSDVLRLVLRNGARLTVIGLAFGIPAAIGMSQALRGFLYGVSATDPLTILGIAAMLVTVALVASYLPARRATRVDPVTALRNE